MAGILATARNALLPKNQRWRSQAINPGSRVSRLTALIRPQPGSRLDRVQPRARRRERGGVIAAASLSFSPRALRRRPQSLSRG